MRKNRIIIGLMFLVVFTAFLQIHYINPSIESKQMEDHENFRPSGQESYMKQWIENPFFTSMENWTSSKGVLGDPNDLNAYIDTIEGEANFEAIGEIKTMTIDDPINIANSGNWEKYNKTEPAINPDTAIIDNNGFYVSHSWHDATADQFASVYWKYNVSMDVDMSEYEITSASINTTMYANVDPNIDTEYDTYARFSPDELIDQPGIFDHAYFIVEIADLNMTDTNIIAYNQTNRLGKDTAPTYYTIADKKIEQKGDEEDLIYYLTKAFENDPGHDNFTIIVGIEINCEDDYTGQDYDDWTELRIKSLNLTFTYEKKIDKFSSISWNQEGDKPNDMSSDTVVVNEALFGFNYKINETWLTESPNSEIRIKINDNKHSETIKLSSANKSYQVAKLGGFDVTYLIDEDKEINVSIQLYIGDDFSLNRTFKISIDDIYLNISYTVIFADYQTNIELYLNGVNKTSSPFIIIPIGQNVTITVKYTNQTGHHIPEAGIQLTGIGILENLKEFANNYSITINTTRQLSMDDNYLNIEATKTNFETRFINPIINVRKINTEILTVSGEPSINIDVGQNAQIRIMLNDTDNDELIKGAIVTYRWTLDNIPRVLTETDGIYEGVIENPPEGPPYTITISAFAGDDYEFEDFEISLYVGAYVPPTQPDLGWLVYVLIGAILGLVLVFTLYQTHFKYPPMVRKIRKLKKNVRKSKKTKPIIVTERDEMVKNSIQNNINILNLDSFESEKIKQNNKFLFKEE